MKRISLLLVMAAIAVVDISAQHEVRITTKDGTTVLQLDEIESIQVTDEMPWESLGMATYTDACIAPLFGQPVSSHPVEVLVNKGKPGIFRLVDPYGPNFALFPYATSHETGTHIDIDATDPEGVWIEGWQSTGLDVGYGVMSITSMAWYQVNRDGTTKAEAKDAGLCGVLTDGVITFPAKGLIVEMGGKVSYANPNGEWKLDMNNMQPAEAAVAKAPAIHSKGTLKVFDALEGKKSENTTMGIKNIKEIAPRTIVE